MGRIQKFTLSKDEKRDAWQLTNDTTDRVVRRFDSKSVRGREGGSVKIQKENGRFQEERTCPRAADPRSSKG